jgi:hypothetical protein
MRRALWISILAIVATAMTAEVIDRIVAVVNRTPILASDWDEELRFEAFVNGRTAAASANERSAALERLIEQTLIEQQMSASKYAPAREDEIRAAVEQIRKQIAPDDTAWAASLRQYGLTGQIVTDHVRRQVNQLRFIELRFTRGAEPKPEAVQRYYNQQYVAKLHASGATEKPLADVREQIERILTEQRVDELLASWLKTLRAQAQIDKRFPETPAQSGNTDAGGRGRE